LKYRPEIDGLRAIAVLAVVIYHAQFGSTDAFYLSGGYVGVDIFFVISGFLITSIILRELKTENFRFADFYERRARRILPALFTVISCSIPFAWWLMLPKAMKEYAGSILSSIFFGSNFWFWKQDSYTAEPSLLKPFLHTWSLSVEEQFYLFFPIFLLMVWRFAKQRLLVICAVVFAISLCIAHWASHHHIDANFYLLPTRMWELSGGVLLAVWQSSNNTKQWQSPLLLKEFVQVLGAAALILSFVYFDHETRHPSLITLLPVVGTMLIIMASQPALLITKLFSGKLIVLIGKWSYSFYLWHFPVFAFARIHEVAESALQKTGLVIASLVLASLTYYWIEQPARRKNAINTAIFTRSMGVWFALLTASMLTFYMTDGVPQRLGVVRDLFESAKIIDVEKHRLDCHQRLSESSCYFPGEADRPILINVGDSHAKTLGNDLKNLAAKHGFGYSQLTANNCPLVLDAFSMIGSELNNNCHPSAQAKRFARIKNVRNAIIIMSGRYPLYLSAEGFDNQQGGKEDIPPIWISDEIHKKNDLSISTSLIQSTFNSLLDTGAQIVMVYPIPEAGWDIPKLVRKKLDGYPASQKLDAFESLMITTTYDVFKQRAALSYQVLNGVADRPNLTRVFPSEALCDEITNRCFTHSNDALFYHDDDHLGPAGSALVVDQIEKLIVENTLDQ